MIDDVLGYFWALGLMLLGIWVIVGAFIPHPTVDEGEPFAIDLQGAQQAKVKIGHGAGQIEIAAGAPAGQVLTGIRAPGLNFSSRLVGERLEVDLTAGPTFLPFLGPSSGAWRFRLNGDVPLNLEVDVGASRLILDLSDLLVNYAKLGTGASSVDLTLPRRPANSLFDIEAGAASLDIRVPEGVAIRVRVQQGISSVNIDGKRFPRLEGGIYQSPDFDKAANRAELNIEAGVGSVKIH